MVLFALLSVSRVALLFFFSTYDAACIVYEHASIVDCHQDAIMSPESAEIWILSWAISSLIGSGIFIGISCSQEGRRLLNYSTGQARRVWKKGSFISVAVLFVITLAYYIYRCVIAPSDVINKAISVLEILWLCTMIGVVRRLNYIHRVDWNGQIRCRFCPHFCPSCLCHNICFFFYWIALITFFLETLCMWIAVALDVAHEVAPLINQKFEDEPRIKGILVLVLGFSLGFHSNMLSFFWNKIFHGGHDLFSEPTTILRNGIQAATHNEEHNDPSWYTIPFRRRSDNELFTLQQPTLFGRHSDNELLDRFRFGFQYPYRYLNLSFSQLDVPDLPE